MLSSNGFTKTVSIHASRCGVATAVLLGTGVVLAGCSTTSLVGGSGPSTRAITRVGERPSPLGVQFVDVTDEVAHQLHAASVKPSFSATFTDTRPVGTLIGRGDTISISIWEAPPSALFTPASVQAAVNPSGVSAASVTALPDQMVGSDGAIVVPFAGAIQAAGRTPHEVEAEIVQRLRGKAHEPQALVRIDGISSSNVTVMGDVDKSVRMPLTSKGERLLDAIAAAGGSHQPAGKLLIQLTRGNQVATMPLPAVLADPRQDIMLQPGDVVTALYQPFSFSALGASGRNEEINFEGPGITLAQALGRMAGLQDSQANPKGVFIFRYEQPEAVRPFLHEPIKTTADGRTPVIYHVDLRDPNMLFVAQGFPIRDKDVIYVSTAPVVDVEKLLNVLSGIVVPLSTARTAAY